jgi:hypothetical protein
MTTQCWTLPNPDWTVTQKICTGVISAVAAIGIIAQTTLTIFTIIADGHGLGFALIRVSGYFTVWTNVLVVLVCGLIAVGRLPRNTRTGALIAGGTAYAIAMVGIIYHILLARQFDPSGLWFFTDNTVHSLTPLAMVGFWLWAGPTHGLRLADGLIWLVWPSAYVIHALGRGAITGWYPYFFLDVGNLGWSATLINVAGLLVVFAVAALAFVALGRLRGQPVTA